MTRDEVIEVMSKGICGDEGSAHLSWLGKAESALTAVEGKGMVVVPSEPTEAMRIAGAGFLPDYDPGCDDAENCYRAMIEAAKG